MTGGASGQEYLPASLPRSAGYLFSTFFNGLQGFSFFCLSVHDAMLINIIIAGSPNLQLALWSGKCWGG